MQDGGRDPTATTGRPPRSVSRLDWGPRPCSPKARQPGHCLSPEDQEQQERERAASAIPWRAEDRREPPGRSRVGSRRDSRHHRLAQEPARATRQSLALVRPCHWQPGPRYLWPASGRGWARAADRPPRPVQWVPGQSRQRAADLSLSAVRLWAVRLWAVQLPAVLLDPEPGRFRPARLVRPGRSRIELLPRAAAPGQAVL